MIDLNTNLQDRRQSSLVGAGQEIGDDEMNIIRVIKLIKKSKSLHTQLYQTTECLQTARKQQHHRHIERPSQNHLTLLQIWRQRHILNPLSLIIFISSILLVNYISNSSPGKLMLAMSHELPQSINQSSVQPQQPPPSQLFLPPANPRIQPVSLVNGFHQKRSEDEEAEGFIMQASSSSAQTPNESNTFNTIDLASATTETTTSQQQQDDVTQNSDQNDERIPIDINRQQFVTHDQLSLLNATTKDESIYLPINGSGSSGLVDGAFGYNDELPMINRTNDSALKAPTSRSGMSKVSHVSSFLSGKFFLLKSSFLHSMNSIMSKHPD